MVTNLHNFKNSFIHILFQYLQSNIVYSICLKWPLKQFKKKAWNSLLLVIYYLMKRKKEGSSETMRRTIIKVQRIAVKIIAVLCTAPLLIQSLLPLWLELPNQLPQHIWSMATIQWCSSFATQKCESRPSTCNSLTQLPELHPPEATHGGYFHFSSKFPPISMRACIARTRGNEESYTPEKT